MADKDRWLDWALELQALAQEGLYYGTGPFDLERYERIREIAAKMISADLDIPLNQAKTLFCSDVGYVTPKLDTRAAIFKKGKILLVQEKCGTWSMPGGWVDADTSIMENTIKEALEESGLTVKPERLAALVDLDKHNLKLHPFKVIKAFVVCTPIEGEFEENIETVASRYFDRENLPELTQDKNTKDQVLMCFAAREADHWETVFD